ncbi:hypothetical protein BJ508DRAFT_367388 [Ascobolus immersus RN42]|uniref:F-box domain-containing protein n=1 Tax=Ascobolus immersus RN42 TaxID=1160509 RepID=A0A3N4HGI9_ASCIM|nr:hypothetical protein BJ508DRAFT_367388 [Ascobolus immersus RN42]
MAKPEQSLNSSSTFLTFPTNIRLHIYSYCTALTLLQLAHTSSRLHTEINEHPKVVLRSQGYQCPPLSYFETLAEIPEAERTPDYFRIRFVGSLADSEEIRLFNRIYLPLQGLQDGHVSDPSHGGIVNPRLVCEQCRMVKRAVEFGREGDCMNGGLGEGRVCAVCRWKGRHETKEDDGGGHVVPLVLRTFLEETQLNELLSSARNNRIG